MRWVLAVLLLAGCESASGSGATTGAPALQPLAHQLDTRGVQLLDRPQRIDFGRTDHSTEQAMAKILARDPVQRGACAGGAQFVAWEDGTVLVFRGGDFRGWARGAAQSGLTCAS